MKIKKTIFLLVVFLLTLCIGCNNPPQDLPGPAPDSTKQGATLKYGDINDPVELEKLWQEYFYDSITTIGNTKEFKSAQEIEPVHVAMFAWFKYVSEHGQENLELAGKDSTLRIFPLDIVLEYAKRYFDLSSIDVSRIEAALYDQQKRAFLFNFGSERNRPAYNAVNSWGSNLGRVTRTSDGTITAVLVRRETPQNGLIESTRTYTLKQRKDGTLYFVSGRTEYVNNNLVSLTGNYQRFDKITGFEGNSNELAMLGEVDNKLLLANAPYEKGKKAFLLLVNPENMQVEKRLELQDNAELTEIRLLADKIAVRLKDKITIVDKNLTQVENIALPSAIKAIIEREPKYDRSGIPDVFFGGYDVSSDFKKIVYADEIGLKLFNIADNSAKLLSPSVPVAGDKLIKYSWHRAPRFVDKEQKVVTVMTAYEGTRGYTLCDLETGAAKTYDISSEGSSTGVIRYDTGLLEVNNYMRGEYKTLYLDFQTGDVKEIKLDDAGDTGYINPPSYSFVGQNYAAFINHTWDSDMFYLNRLNLKTFQVEPRLVSVKKAETNILGVLADGRVLFWYNLNPSENGVCLTN